MDNAFRVLVVEDNPLDFSLVEREFSKRGLPCDFRRVDSENAFIEALHHFDPHLVISDFDLPAFNALQALALLQAYRPHVPFVLVTGVLPEHLASAMLNLGASAFVLKKDLDQLVSKLSPFLPQRDQITAIA